MRKILFLMVGLLLAGTPLLADETNKIMGQTGVIDFNGVNPMVVLNIYEKLTGLELDIPPEVRHSSAPIKFQAHNLTRTEAVKAFEKILNEQAHVIITKIDDKHAKVTIKAEKPADH